MLAQFKLIPNDGSAAESDPWRAEFTTNTPWSYLQGLKLDLFALAKAGAEPVQPARISDVHWPPRLNGRQQCPNVCFQDISDYLAKLENFIISFSKKLQPRQLWQQLRHIDERARQTWCELYRRNKPLDISFSQCIEFTKPWMDLEV